MNDTRGYRKPIYQPEEYRQRPRDFDPGVADLILDRIANGETLVSICSADRDMPLPGTFVKWCDEDPALAERHALARRRGADVNFDEALDAAYHPDTTRARVVSEALFRHVEKTAPEKYSPRAVLKNPGDDNDKGGYDAGAELRRRVEAMAARNKASSQSANSGEAGQGA